MIAVYLAGYGSKMSLQVSIIIPVYNAEKYLEECIESCLNQTYANTEIIAVNDGSTDRSSEILDGYSDRVRIITKENGGIASAVNAGIKRMRGEWYKKMDADDMLRPDAVENLAVAAKKIADPSIIPFMQDEIMHEDGRITRHDDDFDTDTSPFEPSLMGLSGLIHGGAVHLSLISKDVFKKVGAYNEDVTVGEDYELFLRICIGGYKFHRIPGVIYTYRKHDNQITRTYDGQRAVRKIASGVLSTLGETERKKYENGLKKYTRNKSFKSGVWYYGHLGSPAASRDRGGGT